jgi:hypothetical protein
VQFLVRVSGDSASVKTSLRQAVRAADPLLWVNIQTMEERLEPILGPRRTIALCLSGFGVLALLMACGNLRHPATPSARGREIGIRMALEHRREILSMVMTRTLC